MLFQATKTGKETRHFAGEMAFFWDKRPKISHNRTIFWQAEAIGNPRPTEVGLRLSQLGRLDFGLTVSQRRRPFIKRQLPLRSYLCPAKQLQLGGSAICCVWHWLCHCCNPWWGARPLAKPVPHLVNS
jgi:hypothetical protein